MEITGEDVGHEDNAEEFILELGSRGDIGGVIPGVLKVNTANTQGRIASWWSGC